MKERHGATLHDMDSQNTSPSSDQRYLDKLEFKPELRKSFLNFFVTNFRVVLLLIAVLLGIGAYAFTRLPRESMPEVKIPIAVVVTGYPGASPADVEELVTKKIETGISNVKDVDTITSSSANSLSSVTVEFNASADLEASLRALRDAVGNVSGLPDQATEPRVVEISMDDTPIWTAALTSPVDGIELRKHAETIQKELENIPGVREVNVSGGDETEFEVAYDPLKISQYGISVDQANQVIKAANLAIPAGSFEGTSFNYPVRADGRFMTASALSALPLFHTDDGAIVALGDVADVREVAKEKTVLSRLAEAGQPSQQTVTIQIVKKTGGSIIDTVDAATRKIDELLPAMPEGTQIHVVNDLSDQIREDFNQLTHDFILTLILVFSILFLIVGLKEAFVAGLAVPLVFSATFGIMYANGISLNFLSMFSLILSLGLLVDDAIVVVSATKQYLNTGKFTPEEAVLLVLNDFKVVLTTTTLTTVWAFLPLLMASGIIGQFIKSIPITVTATLLSSLVIALIINHPLAAVLERIRLTRGLQFFYAFLLIGIAAIAGLTRTTGGTIMAAIAGAIALLMIAWSFLPKGRRILRENALLTEREWEDDGLIKEKLRAQGAHGGGSLKNRLMHGILGFSAVLPYYERALRRVIATRFSRVMAFIVIGAMFLAAILLPVTGVVKTEFFPNADSDYFSVNIEAPAGLKLSETDAIARNVESILLNHKEIKRISTIVGSRGSTSSFFTSSATPSHTASVTVNLVPRGERSMESYELADELRNELRSITNATVTISTPTAGPPTGAAIDAQIHGDDLSELTRISNELRPVLASIPGVVSTDVSLKSAPADYTFTLLPDRMELYGVNTALVGSTLRTAISGSEVTSVLRDGDETKVVATYRKDRLPTLEDVQNLQILNLKNQPIFLKDVAKIELLPGVESITRIDQKRTVELTAGVDPKTRPAEALSAFQRQLGDHPLPKGYSMTFGGENETNQESVLSIIRAMIIALVLIVATMIVQFNSLRKAAIVIITIPLAMTGVMFGLAMTGITLSFPGLIGLVALFGIVVKNAIILVDKISLNRKFGIVFDDAVIDAGKSRLEAIFITSICTIIGIIPITLSNATWRALGGAMISGLMLSSFFTLFVVPTLYISLFSKERRKEAERAAIAGMEASAGSQS